MAAPPAAPTTTIRSSHAASEVIQASLPRSLRGSRLASHSRSRLRWSYCRRLRLSPPDHVLPEDSSCFQWSEVMAGIASDLHGRLTQLFAELVERRATRQRRDEMEVWTGLEAFLRRQGLLGRIDTQVEVKAPSFSYQFRAGWLNGVQQVLEPISLDHLAKSEVIDKANRLVRTPSESDCEQGEDALPVHRGRVQARPARTPGHLRASPAHAVGGAARASDPAGGRGPRVPSPN